MDTFREERREEARRKMKKMTKAQIARQKSARKYCVLVGVELFSRYAYARIFRVFNPFSDDRVQEGTIVLPELETKIEELPSVDKEAAKENLKEDGVLDGLGGKDIVETLKIWFEDMKRHGFDLSNVVTDRGSEFDNADVRKFLENTGVFSHPVQHVFSVANDRVANPIAERFIGTFKRLFGQFITSQGILDVSQQDVDQIIDFYNDRIHSSTGYTPKEVLFDENKKGNQDVLSDLYRSQKNSMYLTLKPDIPVNTYVRVFTKWDVGQKESSEYRSNEPSWSYTLFKVSGKNKKDNMYLLKHTDDSPLSYNKLDKRDKKLNLAFKENGLRVYSLKVIDYDAFQKYNS